ncbi:MAG: class I SAM-dependent methyltransferase [Cyanobacteria bacterium P01_A01_bin.80]
MIAKFLASQLRKPSGWIGKRIIAKALNRDNASMNNLALRMLNLESTDDNCILELGFGGGYLLNKILQFAGIISVTGVDISPEMLDLCKKHFQSDIKSGKLKLKCASIENLPEFDHNFTHICTVNTIYFWSDIQEIFTRLYQLLEEEGLLVICFNTKEFLQQTNLAKYGFKTYESKQIENLMRLSGFRNINHVFTSEDKQSFVCIIGRK